MRIIFLPEALDYFNKLTTVLYEEEYFGFEENALKYVDELIDDITNTLHLRLKKPAPIQFEKIGRNMFYCSFRKNKRTTWYIFFTQYQVDEERVYLVRHITNNHELSYSFL